MNIVTKIRAIATLATLCGLATQANVASAGAFCRAQWPVTITQCQNSEVPADNASGSGTNTGGTNRTVTANRISGGTSAQAAALDAGGVAIAACTTPVDTTINGTPTSITCVLAAAPPFYFITVN